MSVARIAHITEDSQKNNSMRKRFETQNSLFALKIEDTKINLKSRDSFDKLMISLKEIYTNTKYRKQIFDILEKKIIKPKAKTGRRGMNLWQIFVLSQTRMVLNISYDRLLTYANNNVILRQLLGVELAWNQPKIEFKYQNIVDNVKLLDEETLKEINAVICQLGYDVFKHKENDVLRYKTDSFVVLSNVHYPTDYSLLWDSERKTIDCIIKMLNNYKLIGWRKIKDWHSRLKSCRREFSLSGNRSIENRKKIASRYLKISRLFLAKVQSYEFPLETNSDLLIILSMEYYIKMIIKHIDLFERRIIKGEEIPHSEKVFSIFEDYTEWITKGKKNPSFELGKNLAITTNQYNLIVDYQIMEHEVDKEIVINVADRLMDRYNQTIGSWSFDKGFYSKTNKELLNLYVDNLVMPKKGKLNKKEFTEEHEREFKKYRNKHSAIESNINELEHRGLNRCPDRGYHGFKRYIGMGVCAYNLHRIGAELIKQENKKNRVKKRSKIKLAA